MSDPMLRHHLAKWFNRLGSSDPGWWADEIYAYLSGYLDDSIDVDDLAENPELEEE